jgi:hypothetical protein
MGGELMSVGFDFCEQLVAAIEDVDLPIRYLRKFREVGIAYSDGGTSYLLLVFCPFCGSSLPESLRRQWFDELDVLGLEPDDPNIPAALTTDLWWQDSISRGRKSERTLRVSDSADSKRACGEDLT